MVKVTIESNGKKVCHEGELLILSIAKKDGDERQGIKVITGKATSAELGETVADLAASIIGQFTKTKDEAVALHVLINSLISKAVKERE